MFKHRLHIGNTVLSSSQSFLFSVPQMQDSTSPVTSVTWLFPAQDDTKYVLASAQARAVHIHHVTTQKLLASAYLPGNTGLDSSVPGESILTVAASPNSGQQMLATGGSDGSLALFDRSLANMRNLFVGGSQSGGGPARAHSSRVVALEWHPGDPNLLFSGGWDLTVKVLSTEFLRNRLLPHAMACRE